MAATHHTHSAHIVGETGHVVPLQIGIASQTLPREARRPSSAPMARMTAWHRPVLPFSPWRRVNGGCTGSLLGAMYAYTRVALTNF